MTKMTLWDIVIHPGTFSILVGTSWDTVRHQNQWDILFNVSECHFITQNYAEFKNFYFYVSQCPNLNQTSKENVPGWITMSHNVILVLSMQYFFWGCSTNCEDAVQFLRMQKAKTLILMSHSVSTCPNKYKKMSQDDFQCFIMSFLYWGCSITSEDAVQLLRM